jgi:OmpA-OmpF porin, OOP family
LIVSYPSSHSESKENPQAYFGENKFYNRWVHIAISYFKKHLVVYLDQYKQIDISDCLLSPNKILVTGNTSQNMKILLKNFIVAEGSPVTKIEFNNGKFMTHAIKFDVNKAIIKPESMGIINQITKYLTDNPSVKIEIGGHTDSDGEDSKNLKLSEDRANAVKNLLIQSGVKEAQLTAKGYGETQSIDTNNTIEGKANNRRVEFIKL